MSWLQDSRRVSAELQRRCKAFLLWILVVEVVFILPLWLSWLTEDVPDETYAHHLPFAVLLIGGWTVLLIAPSLTARMELPDEHFPSFRYALRSGRLPLASLFCDWSQELETWRRHYQLVLRLAPIVTTAGLALDVCGLLVEPQERTFYTLAAVGVAIAGPVAYASAAMKLRNIISLGKELQAQQRILAPYRI